MAFRIHRRIFNSYGEIIEKAANEYVNQLTQLFEESPEGQALLAEQGDFGGWTGLMLDTAIKYLSVKPTQMTPDQMREVLFELFPRKISAPAEEAPEIVHELRAFWQFLQREFELPNAAACLAVLNDKAVKRVEHEMSNPANFGMAKSLMMMGMQRGFDLETQEGIDEWIKTYNTEMAAGIGQPLPLPGEQDDQGFIRQLKKKLDQYPKRK